MRQALQEVHASGAGPVAIFGAGEHTAKVMPALLESPVRIAAFIDDDATRQDLGLAGWPVVPSTRIGELGIKSLVISTDRHEPAIWARRDRYEALGIRVLRLYPELDHPEAIENPQGLDQIEFAMDRRHALLPREALQAYWSSRGAPEADDSNALSRYTETVTWSCFLADWIAQAGLRPDSRILELGCNIGRNLAFLRYRGFTRLSAIEINPNAIAAMRDYYPETAAALDLKPGALETVLPTLPSQEFDLVFSMAVLVHIHSDSEFVFAEAVRVSRRYVLTVEDERSEGARHRRRNYEEVFTALGCRQVRTLDFATAGPELTRLLGLQREYVARLFERV
jgi:SAM-dependent methyltransferase